MKITLFTSNDNRHNYFINLLSTVADELFVIQECKTIFPGIVPGQYKSSELMKKYFNNVRSAQLKLFGNSAIKTSNKKTMILSMLFGEINKCSMEALSNFLSSDLYIVFGSSYIKGDLIDVLVKKKAINIHAGIVPYYRGNDCNFWALCDDNPHLVGSTIHILSKGLDSGDILYHAMSNMKTDPFIYTMSTVKSAFHSVIDKIKDGSILKIKSEIQNKKNQIRYSKSIEFNDEAVKKFFDKKINLEKKSFQSSLLKDPYFIN